PERLEEARWASSERYLRGIDLFNFGYFWECHEVFEAIWHGAGKTSVLGQFAQGMVQIAAAHIKRAQGAREAAEKLLARGLLRLAAAPAPYLGVDVRRFEREVMAYFRGEQGEPARIALILPDVRSADGGLLVDDAGVAVEPTDEHPRPGVGGDNEA